jgi:phage anti-repressor protein
MELSQSLVVSLLQSKKEFPVNFDDAWQWLEFSRKDSAKRSFEKAKFIDGFDFKVFHPNVENPQGGRPEQNIELTVDCLKTWAMMVNTSKGKQVRKYFLDCETELKKRIEEEKEHSRNRIVKAVVSDCHIVWQKRFEDQFFEEAYRITGWSQPHKGHPPCMGTLIKNTVYGYFPDGVTDELNRVNPRKKYGRSRKHHQHLKEIGMGLLDSQKAAVYAVMRLSPDNDYSQFKHNLKRALGNSIQLELPFIENIPS